MTVSVTAKTRTIINGTANDGNIVEAIQTELYNNDGTLAGGINGVIGTDSIKGAIDGKFLVLRNTYAGSPGSTDHCGLEIGRGTSSNVALRWNETSDTWEVTNDGSTYYPILNANTLYKIRGSAAPVYASASTFTLAHIFEINNDSDGSIRKATSTTIDISTTGLNGVAQSAALTGTVAVTNGSAVITGTGTQFAIDLQAGDVISVTGSQTLKILSVASNTSATAVANFTTTVSGATYKRGGEAPNTHYHLYATTDGTTPGAILSTRNLSAGDTLVDLPTGYTKYRQLAFSVRNDSSSNIINFTVAEGWPYRPRIQYNVYFPGNATSSTTQVLALTGGASFTTLSLSAYVPPISRLVWLHTIYQNGTVGSVAQIRQNGVSHNGYEQYPLPSSYNGTKLFPMETNSSQEVQYSQGATGNFYVYVHSFVVTEVV